MNILCNGDKLTLPEGSLLTHAISDYLQQTPSVAVAVNQTIIPASQWQHHELQPDDAVELFTLVAGG
ncbi:sulfur carrier protein ThiS [Alteromonas sp. NFXS44]|uniref:sulfur carrier protein ThiS n=1 Tax=Alteromonas sp. NFXS44 TaxID=2818435 RepID=UPI0032DE86F1